MESFVHLHAHTSYSVLDGAVRVEDLVAECARQGMPAVAVTDHGNLHGAAEFHRLAVAAGITPVVGYEAYVAPGPRVARERGPGTHHTMWARNAVGLRNLAAVSTAAFGGGRWPRVDVDLVAAHAEGLMGTTGCGSGEVSTLLRLGREPEALEVAARWRDVYGPDDFFVELMDHGVERPVRDGLVRIAAALDAQVVVTNDVHHLRPEDAALHRALAAVRTGKTVRDPSLVGLAGTGHHLRSAREMCALDSSDVWRRGCRTTLEVAEKVDVTGMFARADPVVSEEVFRDRVRDGLRRRFPGGVDEARVEREVDVLLRQGLSSELLVVADLVAWAAGAGVRLGPGVGRGSLVAYALGVTEVDPVEAFPEAPDLVVEVDERRRDDAVRHLEERWGASRVAAFALVKDSGRLPHPDLVGLVRDVGVEPAAVVVAGERVPLWTRPGDGAAVTQFDLATCRALGLAEVSVVGSAEVAVVDDALRNVVLNGKPAVVLDGGSVADWTARLAADHPAEHLAAVLDVDPSRAVGAAVLPPDVNESRRGFTAVGEAVRYGLGAVRHVEPEVVEAIVRAREERGRFVDFFDYLRKVDPVACARNVVEALVKAGAFDSLGHPRKGLHLVHAEAVDAVLAAKRAEAGGQFDLFGIEEVEVAIPDERWEPEEEAAFQREALGVVLRGISSGLTTPSE